MSIPVGLSICVFGRRPPIEDDFLQFRDAGIRHVELSLLRGWEEPGCEQTIDNVCRWIDKYNITVNSVHGPSGAPVDGHWLAEPDEEVRKRNMSERRLVMDGARRFGAKYVITEYECYPQWPYWPHESPAQRHYSDCRRLWKQSVCELLDDSARTGVKLAIENVDGLPCQSLVEDIADLDPSLVGICFDSSHATYTGACLAEFRHLAGRVIGTHLSDNDGLCGRQWVDRHWSPFSGNIDWPSLVADLVQEPQCDCLIVEVLDPAQRITPELAKSLERLQTMVNALDAR